MASADLTFQLIPKDDFNSIMTAVTSVCIFYYQNNLFLTIDFNNEAVENSAYFGHIFSF